MSGLRLRHGDRDDVPIPGFWSKDDEANKDQEESKHLCGNGRARSSAIGQDRTQIRSSRASNIAGL